MRDEALMLNRIKDAHKASHKAYGNPRIRAEFNQGGAGNQGRQEPGGAPGHRFSSICTTTNHNTTRGGAGNIPF